MTGTCTRATKGPGPRPVYALGAGLRIEREFRALRFEAPDKAPRFVPLRLISRLVVAEGTRMDLDVLCACGRRGIPVVVRGCAGDIPARVFGIGTAPPDLRQRLIDLNTDYEWPELFDNWMRSNLARIAAVLRRRLGLPAAVRGPRHTRRWILAEARRLAGAPLAERSATELHAFSVAFMQERLAKAGLDATNEAWIVDRVDLPAELGALMAFQLEPLRLGWLRRRAEWERNHGRAADPPPDLAFVRLFERHSGRAWRISQDLLNRLERWLVEMA